MSPLSTQRGKGNDRIVFLIFSITRYLGFLTALEKMSNPHYLPTTLLTDSKDPRVSTITISAHSPNSSEVASQIHVNHWVIYLKTSEDESIQLDISPNATTVDGSATLIIIRLMYALSTDVVKHMSFPAIQGLSVRHVLDLILEREATIDIGTAKRPWNADIGFILS